MSGILLLQFYDDASDVEAIARLSFALRWKVALGVELDFDPPHSSSLSVFRRRLLAHGKERYAFDRLLAVGRAAGFLPQKVTLLMDTTPQLGAGAVQDTYTLLRKGIRRLLKAAGYQAADRRGRLAANLSAYLESDRKAEIDWHDPAARAAQLKVLVEDARAALEVALAESDEPEVRSGGWLLTKILGDDLVTDEHGDPQIGRGVAPDRILSLTAGHKAFCLLWAKKCRLAYSEYNPSLTGIHCPRGDRLIAKLTLSHACERMIRYKIGTGKIPHEPGACTGTQG